MKREVKMNGLRKERFEFIPEELYIDLDKEVLQFLLDYREKYRLFVLKQKRIDTLTKNLKEQKELLNEIRDELNYDLLPHITFLKNDYKFSSSVVGFNKGKKRYYNLCVSRTGHHPKNCSLGNEDTIKKHLLDYYKGNQTVIRKIKSDWKEFLKKECNKVEDTSGKTYTRIMGMIMKNPIGFKNQTINRHTLFPIKQTKRK